MMHSATTALKVEEALRRVGREDRRVLAVLLDEQVTRIHIRDMQLRLSW